MKLIKRGGGRPVAAWAVSAGGRCERRQVLAAYGSLRREGAGAEVGGHVVAGASARVEERGVTVAMDDQEPRVGELAGHGDRVPQRRGRVGGVADHQDGAGGRVPGAAVGVVL